MSTVLVDLVLKIRVEVEREPQPDVDDTEVYDAEELLRSSLDRIDAIRSYEFILAATK